MTPELPWKAMVAAMVAMLAAGLVWAGKIGPAEWLSATQWLIAGYMAEAVGSPVAKGIMQRIAGRQTGPTCPQCEASALIPEKHDIRLDDGVAVFDLEHYACPACGADPVFSDQIKRNQAKIKKAREAQRKNDDG